uniref:Uncharacterized protein n=1 Tax=Anguilla anguilla TaxID=7936 RepID=A0A0E9XHW2_ANGAN
MERRNVANIILKCVTQSHKQNATGTS